MLLCEGCCITYSLLYELPSVVVCQLESSGKWPEDLEAVRMVKVAFYIHMAKALGESSKIVASPTKEYLDILKVCIL